MQNRSKQENLANYDIGGCLPHELTIEILLRLPAKSLGRFQLVSKTWRSQISDPWFIKSHVRYLNNSTTLLFGSDDLTSVMSLSVTNGLPHVSLIHTIPGDEGWGQFFLGSCHGLVCFHPIGRDYIYLCNLATRQRRQIFFPSTVDDGAYISLPAFKLSWFGYVPCMDDYIILYVTCKLSRPTKAYTLHLFSLRKNTWTPTSLDTLYIPKDHNHAGSEVVLFNDALHWASNHNTMVKFDLVKETFETVPITLNKGGDGRNEVTYGFMKTSTMIIHEKLCVCRLMGHPNNGDGGMLEVWTMEEYGKANSWKKLLRSELKLEFQMYHTFLGFTCDGKILIRDYNIVSDVSSFELVHVDPSRDPRVGERLGGFPGFILMLHYVDSLMSPFTLV